MPVMQCTTNMDSPKEMLDQKQNWLVSGAYLSHIFRLELNRNHHIETCAQTHPHIQNAKLRPSCSVAERCWTLMPVMQCTTNMDSPKQMLDQKQNWLVSGAYLSHIFRLELNRNHHIETCAQTNPHINTKIHAHTNTKTYITEGQPSMIVYERLNGF